MNFTTQDNAKSQCKFQEIIIINPSHMQSMDKIKEMKRNSTQSLNYNINNRLQDD